MSEPLESTFGIIYGESGMGKTADTIYAFPTGVFLAGPGSLKPARHLCGIEVRSKPVDTLEDVIDLLEAVAAKSKIRPAAFIIDDLSLLQQRSVMTSKKSNYELWRDVLDKVLEIAHIARYKLNAHVWMSAHEAAPKEVRGRWVLGGPLLQGMAAAHLPKEVDLLLRVQREEARPIWPFVYQCNNVDPDYVTKDRTSTCADRTPMNIGEILRAAGYVLPRFPGLEWQEGIAQKIADKLSAMDSEDTDSRKKFLASVRDWALTKYPNRLHVAWAMRDGMDRAMLMKTKNDPLRRLEL